MKKIPGFTFVILPIILYILYIIIKLLYIYFNNDPITLITIITVFLLTYTFIFSGVYLDCTNIIKDTPKFRIINLTIIFFYVHLIIYYSNKYLTINLNKK